jgi:hypothetical protein
MPLRTLATSYACSACSYSATYNCTIRRMHDAQTGAWQGMAPWAVGPMRRTPDGTYWLVQAIEHGHVPTGMYVVTALLLGGAFFSPAPRVAAFATGIVTIVVLYGKEVPAPHHSGVTPVVGRPFVHNLPGDGPQDT